jgi:hypothetical protein
VAAVLFAEHLVGHAFKFESHRLGAERSEGALSWNVFRSLFEAEKLAWFGQQVTGIAPSTRYYVSLVSRY